MLSKWSQHGVHEKANANIRWKEVSPLLECRQLSKFRLPKYKTYIIGKLSTHIGHVFVHKYIIKKDWRVKSEILWTQ